MIAAASSRESQSSGDVVDVLAGMRFATSRAGSETAYSVDATVDAKRIRRAVLTGDRPAVRQSARDESARAMRDGAATPRQSRHNAPVASEMFN
jgi:ethanolamine utilization microcompartment shell protein EutL